MHFLALKNSPIWHFLAFFGLFLSFLPLSHAQESLTVAVASSLYAQLQAKSKAYALQHDVTIRLVSGSTGRLYNQILQGAPFDVFIAADQARPQSLITQGKATASYTMGQGYLGLSIANTLSKDLAQLQKPSIRHIAVANPDVAPFGMATKKLLQQQGLWQSLKSKFVYAQNALQAKLLVAKGLVDAGFIPVHASSASLSTILYQSVLLNKRSLAQHWLQAMRLPKSINLAQHTP